MREPKFCPGCGSEKLVIVNKAATEKAIDVVCLSCEREWDIYDAGVQPSKRIAALAKEEEDG